MFKMPKPLKRQDQHYTIYALIDPLVFRLISLLA